MADTTAPTPPVSAPLTTAPTPVAALSEETATALPTRDALIAKSIAAGRAALAAAVAPVPVPAPATDPVAEIPPPPVQAGAVTQTGADSPKVEEAKPDPMAAFAARFEALEKQNATLLEQLTKLTAKPVEAPKPEAERPVDQAQRTLTDSPFEAQARVYFGDLPKPLMTQATEVLEKRHSWQSELRAAETALASGDAAARERVNQAQYALGKVQGALERIEFDASLAKMAQPQPAPVQGWGVVARDEVVDSALADRANWKADWQSLEDHEVATVLRSVPAGQSPDDYIARARKALDSYVSKRAPVSHPAVQPAVAPAAASPKNPAPPAPAKPETTLSGDVWRNDEILPKHEHMRRIIARGRGDAPTN